MSKPEFNSHTRKPTITLKRHNSNLDRISGLCDSILHRILSFMNIKPVVQTCLISRRWKNLWTSIPILKFELNPVLFQDYKSFKRFVLGVLSNRGDFNIHKFVYTCNGLDNEPNFVKMLLCYAICHNVEELSISAPHLQSIALPSCFSLSGSLNVLSLCGGFVCKWMPLSLLALRVLHIRGASHGVEEFDGSVLSSCPHLESLVFVDFRFRELRICSPKLECLEMRDGQFSSGASVEICTPRLGVVKFVGSVPVVCSLEKLGCLVKVEILIDPMFYGDGDGDGDGGGDLDEQRMLAQNLATTLGVFHSANSITISLVAFELLSNFPKVLDDESNLFCNLKNLILKKEAKSTTMEIPMNVVACLLQRSPSLKTILVEL